MKDHSPNVIKSSEVIGVSVRNPRKENLGKIEEIVLDKFSGQTHYAVLSFGGIMGMGDKLFALPWKSIHYDPSDKCFILDMPKEKLEKVPGFDKDHWPDMAQDEWKLKYS